MVREFFSAFVRVISFAGLVVIAKDTNAVLYKCKSILEIVAAPR
jgi:hypothetical protein